MAKSTCQSKIQITVEMVKYKPPVPSKSPAASVTNETQVLALIMNATSFITRIKNVKTTLYEQNYKNVKILNK